MPELPDEKLYRHAAIEPPTEVAACTDAYAELDVTTNFSFLRGASHPDELVYTAALVGYKALAITDINSVAGVVRAYEAARKIKNFHLIVGCRLVFVDGTPDLLTWVTDRAAYSRLCRLLTVGRRQSAKRRMPSLAGGFSRVFRRSSCRSRFAGNEYRSRNGSLHVSRCIGRPSFIGHQPDVWGR